VELSLASKQKSEPEHVQNIPSQVFFYFLLFKQILMISAAIGVKI
jgi:hypothetical protein